jgi:hypothetical protein
MAGLGGGDSDQVVTGRRFVAASLSFHRRCGRYRGLRSFRGRQRAVARGRLRAPLRRVGRAPRIALHSIAGHPVRWDGISTLDRHWLLRKLERRQPLFTVIPNQRRTAGIGANEQLLARLPPPSPLHRSLRRCVRSNARCLVEGARRRRRAQDDQERQGGANTDRNSHERAGAALTVQNYETNAP